MADTETGYPQMWYHPVNGSYKICQNSSEVPEGFIDNFKDVTDPVTDKYEGPAPCTDFTVPDSGKKAAAKKAAPKKAAAKKAPAKKAAAKKAPAKKAAPTGPTLEALKMSREEAVEMLNEEEVEFDAEADDNALAAMVQELLDEE